MGDGAEDAERRAQQEREEEGAGGVDGTGVNGTGGGEVAGAMTVVTHGAAEKPSVVEAISRVMADVQNVGKTQRNAQQNYVFRGIDAVVNAVGPALRAHGVVVVPTRVDYEVERYTTKSGTEMKGVTTIIDFRFYGPAGDWIDAQAAGESSDAGDKAMPKAHSVTYRTLLLQALCIPTDDPDPDAQSHERASTQARRTGETAPVAAKERKLVAKGGTPIVLPRNWKEIATAFETEFVDHEWIAEAIQKKFGKERRELDDAQSREAAQMVIEMYVALLQILGPQESPGAKRADLRRAFAAALQGVELEGPPWRIHPPAYDPDEAEYPAPTEDDDPDAAPLGSEAEPTDDADDDIPFGDPAENTFGDDAPMGEEEPAGYSG